MKKISNKNLKTWMHKGLKEGFKSEKEPSRD